MPMIPFLKDHFSIYKIKGKSKIKKYGLHAWVRVQALCKTVLIATIWEKSIVWGTACMRYVCLFRTIISNILHRPEVREMGLYMSVFGLYIRIIRFLVQELGRNPCDKLSLNRCNSGFSGT